VFNFKDQLLSAIIGNSRSKEVQEKAAKKLNYVIESDDRQVQINMKNQARLIFEYFQLLASAHECLASRESGRIVY
jgi:hypothetical protein